MIEKTTRDILIDVTKNQDAFKETNWDEVWVRKEEAEEAYFYLWRFCIDLLPYLKKNRLLAQKELNEDFKPENVFSCPHAEAQKS